MVTWLQHPVKRFLSAFYEHYGRGARPRLYRASELQQRYDAGTITPDELAKWPRAADLARVFFDAPHAVRNYMLWNVQTQLIGDTRHYKYRRPSSSYGISPDHPESKRILELAKSRLEAMDFVGVASRFSDSMTLLSWWLGLPPLNVTCSSNLEQKEGWADPNMTSESWQSSGPLSLTDEGVALVEQQNALDLELYRHAERIFEQRWQLMLQQAPERVNSDRYRCHGSTLLRCLPSQPIHSPFYSSRRRCFSYCTNRATEESPAGARLHRAYTLGCSDVPAPSMTRSSDTDAAKAMHTRAPSHGRGKRMAGPVLCDLNFTNVWSQA